MFEASAYTQMAYQHTLKMKNDYENEINYALKRTRFYNGKIKKLRYRGSRYTEIILCDMSCTYAALIFGEKKSCILDCADYFVPGGAFLYGALGQEEELCHNSFLYNILREENAYYRFNNHNRNNDLYLNRALYIPNVYFFKDRYGTTPDIVLKHEIPYMKKIDVLVCSPPNFMDAKHIYNKTTPLIEKALKSRIKYALDIMERQCADTVIIGSYGYKNFGNNPDTIARFFVDALKKYDYGFKRIVFAIPNEARDVMFDILERNLKTNAYL